MARQSGFRLPRPTTRNLVLLAATVLLAYGAATNAAVNAFHSNLPSFALSLNAEDPVALVRDAQLKLAAGSIPPDDGGGAIVGVVRRSVSELAINPAAFRLYGLSSATNADLPGVREQMAISERMERRDAATQLWLIEDAVEQNDVARALRHYDTALRTEDSTRAVLYPVLTDALESPVIRQRFLRYMNEQPPWLESFLRFAVSNTSEPVAIADLAKLSKGFPDGAAYSSLDTELLRQLVTSNDFEAATDHYRRIEGADPGVLTSLTITEASTDLNRAPVTWQPFSIDGINPFILASANGEGALEIESEMEAGFNGPVARKLLALDPGGYALSAKLRGENFGGFDFARWRITCAGSSDQAPLVNEEVAFGDAMEINASFAVSDDCPVQLVQISAATRVRSGYVTLIIAEAELTPSR
ncbi:MAG: hypothetical protein AAGE86_12440 [Pseudomonadota bacterium]